MELGDRLDDRRGIEADWIRRRQARLAVRVLDGAARGVLAEVEGVEGDRDHRGGAERGGGDLAEADELRQRWNRHPLAVVDRLPSRLGAHDLRVREGAVDQAV